MKESNTIKPSQEPDCIKCQNGAEPYGNGIKIHHTKDDCVCECHKSSQDKTVEKYYHQTDREIKEMYIKSQGKKKKECNCNCHNHPSSYEGTVQCGSCNFSHYFYKLECVSCDKKKYKEYLKTLEHKII